MYCFARNKKNVDLRPHIRRICDLTTPNLPTRFAGRSEDRSNRTIPTLICPWEDDRLLIEELSTCLTSDLCDRGVGLVLSQPLRASSLMLGYWIASDEMREPSFFLGDVRRNTPIGGGFWVVGVELTEFANDQHMAELARLKEAARKLMPPAPAYS